jgi:hypothetical protein
MLARLPAVTIQPTLEYDAKPHKQRFALSPWGLYDIEVKAT